MNHPHPARLVILVGFASLAVCLSVRAADDDWKYDVLHLKNGKSFQGLLLEETARGIQFECVRRDPGAPTRLIYTVFQPEEVQGIDRLSPEEREVLEGRIRALDHDGKAEAARMEGLDLEPAPWIKPGGGEAWRYRSRYFELLSDAREDIVRRAAVRLEQIYNAYTRFLPPRRPAGKPTSVLLVHSLAEYRALLAGEGRHILNPAFFDSDKNRVMCACDLERLGDDLQRAREQYPKWLKELKDQEAELNGLYRGRVPAAFVRRNHEDRQRIIQAQDRNRRKFEVATRQLFQTLYHEAFHAYLANFVYAPAETAVPRWLNEGLAQVFETAVVEGDELRVGRADPGRLARLQEAGRRNDFLPLEELLRSGPDQFVVAHASERAISDRHYLNSWGLAFYLMFDRKLLGTPALDRYVRSLEDGADPLAAFHELVGQPLPEFEKEFHHFLMALPPDGSVGR